MTVDITVTGMSCASCVAHVEQAVAAVKGVDSCSVNLLTGLLRAEGENISRNDIIAAVKDAGYGISSGREAADRSLLKLITSLITATVVMALQMSGILNRLFTGIICLVLSLFVIIINFSYFKRGFRALININPNMDTLIFIGSSCSFIYSAALLILTSGGGNMYFDSASMILAFVSMGKYLESRAKKKANNAVKELYSLIPETCELVTENGTAVVEAKNVHTGDTVIIRPGKSVPVDAVILRGETEVDEASLTGESLPVYRQQGDRVYAGTLNLSGSLEVKVTSEYEDTTLSKTIKTVADIQAGKAPVQRTADKIAAYFVPAVLLVSLLTLVFYLFYGRGIGFSLERAVSVLVVSCPCALGLATPVAITCAGLVATRNGVLFKSAESMEITGKIKTAAFDKTGTVTKSELSVTKVYAAEGVSKDELFRAAYTAEIFSEHPAGKAIIGYVGPDISEKPEKTSSIPGKGVAAAIGATEYKAGKPSYIGANIKADGTVVAVSKNDKFLGYFVLKNEVKEGTADCIAELRKSGIYTCLLTGDTKSSTEALSPYFDEIKAELLPMEKAEAIKKLGRPVLMVGDGINDAVALTAADVGFAMGEGTDAAKSAGDAVIKRGGIQSAVGAVKLMKKTVRIIYENLFWALCYNLVGIPLAMGVFGQSLGFYLTPSFCSLAMSFSSVLVVSNSLRILRTDKFFENKEKNIMKTTVIQVSGMMCHNCERHAVNAVKAVYPTAEVSADFEKGTVSVTAADDTDLEKIKAAIREEGYECL